MNLDIIFFELINIIGKIIIKIHTSDSLLDGTSSN
jgi:hypothetical protein